MINLLVVSKMSKQLHMNAGVQKQTNYQKYINAMYELDERSPYTYVWDPSTDNYFKVDWEVKWAVYDSLWECKAKQTFQKIKQMFDEKVEQEKPWLNK